MNIQFINIIKPPLVNPRNNHFFVKAKTNPLLFY